MSKMFNTHEHSAARLWVSNIFDNIICGRIFRAVWVGLITLLRMRIELDHVFICAAPGAPEGEDLVRFGLHEGTPNQHPGQGTACRRFSFVNAMLELLWVSDVEEVRSEATRRTLLWERWSGRTGAASPFGICLRPVDAQDTGTPFPAWEYRPSYLPDSLAFQIGDAGVAELMWVYLSFMRRVDREDRFEENARGIREITSLRVITAVPFRSLASQRVLESGVLTAQTGPESLLEIGFDGSRRKVTFDFRPHLPLIFQL
jgi:hypothetical protein